MLLARGGERLVRALQDPLRADVDPGAGGHLAEHRQPERLEPAELVPRRPARHEQRVRDQHARRARVRAEDADRLAALDEQRLVVAELEQRADDRLQRLVGARGPARAAVDDELLGMLGHLGVEVVEQHPQRRLGLPRARVQLGARAARGSPRGRRRAPRPAPLSVPVTLIPSPPCSFFRRMRNQVHAVATTKKNDRGDRGAAQAPAGERRDDDDHAGEPGVDERGVPVRVASSAARRRGPGHCSSLTGAPPPRPRPPRRASRRGSRPRPRSMSLESERSSRSRGESVRTNARVAAHAASRLERREELDRLRAREQLDRERALAVREHLPRLQPGRVPHRDVILLAGARRDRVDRSPGGRAPCSRRRATRPRTAGS